MVAGEAVGGGDVVDCGVEPLGVVVMDEGGDHATRLVGRGRGLGSDRVSLDGLVEPLQLSVGLGIVRCGPDVGHASEADVRLEVGRDELGSVVGDDAWGDAGVQLTGALDDPLHVGLLHGLAELPVNQEPAATIKDRAEVVEGAGDVDVGDVDVPVLVGLERLFEPRPLLRRTPVPAVESAGGTQHPVDRRRAGSNDVLVDHHEGKPAVPVERVFLVEVEDRLLLLWGEPMVAGDPPVVLVGLPVSLFPGIEFSALEPDPGDEPGRGDLRPLGPLVGEVDDGVAHVGGNPARPIQGSPSAFFSLTCSSVTQAMTASFLATCFSSASTFASSSFDGAAGAGGWSAVAAFSKSCFCQ